MPPKKRETAGAKAAALKKAQKKEEKEAKNDSKGKTKTRVAKDEEQRQLYIIGGGAAFFVVFMFTMVVVVSMAGHPLEDGGTNATEAADKNTMSEDSEQNWGVMTAFIVIILSIFSVPLIIDGYKRSKKAWEERAAAQVGCDANILTRQFSLES
jgi:hypothetical protein